MSCLNTVNPVWRCTLIMPRNSSNATAKRVRTAATRPTPDGKQLFLLKSEPDDFSIDDLAQAGQHAGWEGVRNAQAANILRSMRVGDWALFYHSSCKDKGVVGIAEIVREAYPDATAWDPTSKYFDPKTDQEKPKWLMVDIKLVRRLRRRIGLAELKAQPQLEGMQLLTRPRLSVQQVSAAHWQHVLSLEDVCFEQEEGNTGVGAATRVPAKQRRKKLAN